MHDYNWFKPGGASSKLCCLIVNTKTKLHHIQFVKILESDMTVFVICQKMMKPYDILQVNVRHKHKMDIKDINANSNVCSDILQEVWS